MTRPCLPLRLCPILIMLIGTSLVACFNSETITPQPQNSSPVAEARRSNSGEGKELNVYGIRDKFVMRPGNKRKIFLSQPTPEVWLIADETSPRVELSSESKRVLNEYWVEALRHQLCVEIIRAQANEKVECDTRLARFGNKTDSELQNQTVMVNGITRKVYFEESDKIIRYMGVAAAVSVGELKRLGLKKEDFAPERE